MELRINDYVRTNDGNIFQVTGSDIEFASEIGSDGNLPFNAKIISSKIIDLIEVGDIIRGKDNHLFEVYAVGSDCVYINNLEEFILVNEIKSIVTFEQFSQMEYRIGE